MEWLPHPPTTLVIHLMTDTIPHPVTAPHNPQELWHAPSQALAALASLVESRSPRACPLPIHPSIHPPHPRRLSLSPGAAGGRVGAGVGQDQRGLRGSRAGGWGRLGKSRLSLLGGSGGRRGVALTGMREGGGSQARYSCGPLPSSLPGCRKASLFSAFKG